MKWSETIDCAEEHGTIKEDYQLESGFNASVTLRCAWAERYLLIESLIGKVWPYSPGDNGPACISAGCMPSPARASTDEQSLVYETAIISFNFSNQIKDFISETLEPTAEFQILDYKRFRWSSAAGEPLLEGEAPGLLQRGLNLNRTIYQVETVPTTVLTACGHCNRVAYTSALLGLTFGAETLLFNPPTLSRSIKTNGDETKTIAMKFSFKPNTWNKFFRQKNANVAPDFGWEYIYTTEGEIYKPYQPDDFAGLLD